MSDPLAWNVALQEFIGLHFRQDYPKPREQAIRAKLAEQQVMPRLFTERKELERQAAETKISLDNARLAARTAVDVDAMMRGEKTRIMLAAEDRVRAAEEANNKTQSALAKHISEHYDLGDELPPNTIDACTHDLRLEKLRELVTRKTRAELEVIVCTEAIRGLNQSFGPAGHRAAKVALGEVNNVVVSHEDLYTVLHDANKQRNRSWREIGTAVRTAFAAWGKRLANDPKASVDLDTIVREHS